MKMKIDKVNNYKMNDDTYKLRRQVIDIIYKAKKMTNLPRIDVRIGDARENILGVARMGDCKIWIDVKKCTPKYLLQVVLHELCHAVYSAEHDKNCKLMNPVVQDITESQAWDIFKTYTK